MSIFGSELIDASARDHVATIVGREALDFPEVAAHEARVAEVAGSIAERLGMTEREVAVVRLAGRLHDVGKMFIPLAILRKTGRLDADERGTMESHAAKGADLLSVVPHLPREVIDGARYHHERYDGNGYNGVAGEEIPYVARVLAVADVYDAICSPRTYKPAIREGEALRLMTDDAAPGRTLGRRAFDPVVLRAFVRMRLDDYTADISENERPLLEQYVATHPMSDLSEEMAQRVSIASDGIRMNLDEAGYPTGGIDPAGHPVEAPDRSLRFG